jgi:hypothetical protein
MRSKIALIFVLAASYLAISGCLADWRTTPTTVDRYHGQAVKHMVANQTLYPEHGEQHRQVLLLDGPKAQGDITNYRLPPKVDQITILQKSKERLDFEINQAR